MSLNIELEGSGLTYSIILARLCNLSGTPINESGPGRDPNWVLGKQI